MVKYLKKDRQTETLSMKGWEKNLQVCERGEDWVEKQGLFPCGDHNYLDATLLIINAFIPTHMFPLHVIPINFVGQNTNTKQYQW